MILFGLNLSPGRIFELEVLLLSQSELFDDLHRIGENASLSSAMLPICRYAGAELFLVARYDLKNEDRLDFVVTANWPFDLVRRFAAALTRDQARMSEIERGVSTLQPVLMSVNDDIRLPADLSPEYCVIPFNVGAARLLLVLLFRHGVGCDHDRMRETALLTAYHATEIDDSDSRNDRSFDLTEREVECLNWISEGKTSDEIAMIIGISRNTVNNYITGILRKTATKTRSEVIAFAVRNSLI